MADLAPSRPALLAACVALLALSGCTAAPNLATPTPAPSRAPSGDRPASSGTPASTATPATAATSKASTAGSPPAATSTPSALADVPGSTSTAVPAPAQPGLPPLTTGAEVTEDVRAFMEAARVVTGRGDAVTAASLSAASPRVSALIASGNAQLAGDALRVLVAYDADLAAARAAVEAAGGTVERTDAAARLVQATVPVARLATLQAGPAVTRIRLPEPGVR